MNCLLIRVLHVDIQDGSSREQGSRELRMLSPIPSLGRETTSISLAVSKFKYLIFSLVERYFSKVCVTR